MAPIPSASSIVRPMIFIGGLLVLLAVLVMLGNWQVERRAWKLALIHQAEQYQTAEPQAPPLQADWTAIGKADEYRRLALRGHFLHARETCVQAVTVHGPGYWVMTPLQSVDSTVVLINRGFVPAAGCNPETRPAGQVEGEVTLVGRLRPSEPHGGFLRTNDPVNGRWYSRDVAAIVQAQGLDVERVAPYFVDAEASEDGGPIGGLTVMQFRNHHLGYALTWYGLAVLVVVAIGLILRREWQLRRG